MVLLRAPLLVALLAFGCGDPTSPSRPPDHGHGPDDLAVSADLASASDLGEPRPSRGDAGAAFAAVQAIFDDKCTGCHDANRPPIPDFPGYPQLPLTVDRSYDALISQPSLETCGGIRVVPGNPDASYLLHKVSDATPCDGLRMPRGGNIIAPPLSATEIATIRSWIAAGAPY
jgi:hypothetical protein